MQLKLSVVDQSPIPAGSTPADALRNTVDLAKACEAWGYTRYWMAEHHSTAALACTAPELMIGRLAVETSRMRIGSGAVLLSHYSPLKVAETFRLLHALHPDRIDLGIGRAPGGRPLDAHALARQRLHQPMADDFAEQLLELLAFLHGGFKPSHPFSQIKVQPEMPGGPEVWLLGSSGWSADAAAKLNLPYGAAHFINPESTRRSIEHYKRHFTPTTARPEPVALIAVGAVAADTEAEAQRLYSSQRLRRLLRGTGEEGPIPHPDDAVRRLAELSPRAQPEEGEWPRVIVGSVGQVHERLCHMAEALGVDELMLITVVHDHQARLRSYELLSRAFGLETEASAPAMEQAEAQSSGFPET